MKHIQQLIFISTVAMTIFLGSAVANAEMTSNTSTLTSEQVLPMQIYDQNGAPTKNSLVFRTNGEYELKWMQRRNTGKNTNLLYDGKSTYFYYDNNNIIHAINANGEQKWMSSPMKGKIKEMNLVENGNLFIRMSGPTSKLHITDSKVQPQGTEEVLIMNNKGNRVFESTTIRASSFSVSKISNKEQVVLLTEEGIVSYDLNGQKQWTFSNGILVSKYVDGMYMSNVQDLNVLADGTVYCLTNEKLYQLNPKGELISANKVKLKYLQIDYHTRNTFQREDGLVMWEGKWVTESEYADLYRNQGTIPNTPPIIKWSGGSYSTDKEYRTLIAKDAEDNVLWSYTPDDQFHGYIGNLICNQDGDVYFTDTLGNVFGLDEHGNKLFSLFINKELDPPSRYLFVTPEGGLLGVIESIGMFRIGKSSIGVTIQGENVAFEQQPYLENGTTLVPFRPVFEKLGLKVEWDGSTQTVRGIKEGVEISLQIGKQDASIGKRKIGLTVAPKVINGTTYVPLRFVGEALNLQVEWDDVNREVRIGSSDQMVKQAFNPS